MNSTVAFNYTNILLYINLIPLIGIIILIFTNSTQIKLIKIISLHCSSLPFLILLFVWGGFKKSIGTFQFVTKILWIPILNFNITLGIDGISLFFLLLTTLLIPICILISWNSIHSNLKMYLILFLFIEFFLISVFCVLDLFLFYICFESILIPMFLIIGIWGSRERKILASYYFFLYTLLGSVIMLLSILYIYSQVGCTDYEILLTFVFSEFEQKILWLTFFLAFSAKIPMMPVHLWLPEAHVEAPTAGSVILAGVLLKLGTYGFIRFSLPLFPLASFYFTPFVYTISLIGIIYASLTAIRQTDFKRIIAYTSIAHMNVIILGIFSFNNTGIEGALLQSLSHGFVASALFVIIGIVYERYRTRLVKYYGGLVHTMPLYISIFLFFTMANIGFPGTSGFIGEFLIFAGSFKVNTSITFGGATGMVLGGCYALWLFNRIAYGNLKNQYIKNTLDINKRELFIFLPLINYTLILGLTPDTYLNSVHMSVNNLIENMYF
jgi:proton-translocating NADH-quinone oxidoreductase chain M